MMLIALAGIDIIEVFFIYTHGFPLGVEPADHVRGFGWPFFAAYIGIWAFALAYCRSAVFRRAITARVAAED